MTVNIRQINAEEVSRLEHLGELYFDASGLKGSFNRAHFTFQLQQFMKVNFGAVYAAEVKDVFVGGLVAVFVPDLWTGSKSGAVMAWFTLPAYRGHGMKLLRKFEEDAKEKGCVRVFSGHLTSAPKEFMAELYKRCGYEEQETMYRKEFY